MKRALRDKLAAWLALVRIANLPTVWSNVLVGLACGLIGVVTSHRDVVAGNDLLPLLHTVALSHWPALLAASLFYLGGMILNDVADRRFDIQNRSDRPLAAGQISVASARLAVLVCLVGGLALMTGYGSDAVTIALLLVGAIAAYNLTHKYFAIGVVFMGLCRALLYPLGAAAFWTPDDPSLIWVTTLPFAAAVGGYVILVTFVARAEQAKNPGRRRWLSLLMIPLVLAAALGAPVLPTGWGWLWVVLTGVALAAWLGWCSRHVLRPEPDTKGAVLRWLAGLCLIDAYFLALLGLSWLALVPIALFLVTRLLQRRLAGT
jgi:4-hydroxybenzoate polyprenyltransferase